MIAFDELMFNDDVTLYRHAATASGQGAYKRIFPTPGEDYRASVQTKAVSRVDAEGRTYTATAHTIRTTENTEAVTDDKFVWLGRTLVVEGASKPGGIGDVIWITQCLETN